MPPFADNVKQFPTISFKSGSIKPAGSGKYVVDGTLIPHGVSKPVRLELPQVGRAQIRWAPRSSATTPDSQRARPRPTAMIAAVVPPWVAALAGAAMAYAGASSLVVISKCANC